MKIKAEINKMKIKNNTQTQVKTWFLEIIKKIDKSLDKPTKGQRKPKLIKL